MLSKTSTTLCGFGAGAACLIAVGAAPAAADEGFYLGASVGWVLFSDQDFSVAPFTTVDTDLKSGADGSIYVGYNFGQFGALGSVRADLQYSYREADVDSHSINGIAALNSFGKLKESAGFLNVYYDFDSTGSQWVPYLGAGVGYGEVSFDNYGTLATGTVLDQTKGRWGYQLIAGLGYEIAPQATLFADYKFRDYGDFDVTTTTLASTSLRARSSSFNFGFRYAF